MASEIVVHIGSEGDIVAARQAAREAAAGLGFASSDLAVIATAVSELARNILEYARAGDIVVDASPNGDRRGITIVARDHGPGIADLQLAMQDGYSSSRGLGLGLPGTRRLADDFDIVSQPGCGTTVTVKKWVR